jgi:hypothetical protein
MSHACCPYCDAQVEINHDDGYGYDEERIYEQECGSCEKTFAYRTSISIHYFTAQAPCMNGGEHEMKPVVHAPRCYPNWQRCVHCEHEVRGDFDESTVAHLKRDAA